MNRPYLTISVDDGHPSDLRAAELLSRYGFAATFYVPGQRRGHPMLSEAEVRQLARSFDVGGHTLTHRTLRGLDRVTAGMEILEGKRWLEDVAGARTISFSYPRGKFDATTVDLVREAGYLGARTCWFNRNEIARDPYRCGTSTHATSHPIHIQIRHGLVERNWRGLADFVRVHRMKQDWEAHFLHAVDWVAARGGVAHLFLHSWEIDAHREWDKLERVLAQVAERTELLRVSNAQLFSIISSNLSA